MSDIVERLRRDLASGLSASIGDTKEAADEIERLRDQIYDSIPKWRANELQREIERLRAALRLADAALSGANMNMRAVEKKVRAALKEGE